MNKEKTNTMKYLQNQKNLENEKKLRKYIKNLLFINLEYQRLTKGVQKQSYLHYRVYHFARFFLVFYATKKHI